MSLVSVIETLKEYFGWTDEDVKRKEFNLSFFYYLKKEDIIKKADFYKITFNLTQTEFIKMLKTLPALLDYNNESVLDKANFYMKTFNLTQTEFIKMLKTLPALLSFNNGSVLDKVNFYKNTFNLSQTEFNKMLKTFPNLLCHNNESVLDKVNFYMKTFNLTQTEFNKMLKTLPALLSYNNGSVLDKADFYMTTFNLTQAEFNKMLKTLPSVLGYNNESVLDKKKNFDKIGLDKNDIIKNPSILTAPSNNFIFRYMLLYINFGNKSFLDKIWYMTSEKKTWARYAHIKQNGRAKPADVLISEKNFQKKYGVESSDLMEKFPITKEVVEFVNCEYNKLAEMNGDKKFEIKFEDLQKKDRIKGE